MKELKRHAIITGIIAIACCVIILAVVVVRCSNTTALHLGGKGKMTMTATQIDSLRSIGQWEFLSIADEEVVDTIRHGFFGDDRLARIYYGTLRLGIDLSKAPDRWMSNDKDTVVVTLPKVQLLDDNFVDEARTRSFIETGKWTEADRAALTRKAAIIMRHRCMTEANIKLANDNAKVQMATLVKSMGFQHVRVEVAE